MAITIFKWPLSKKLVSTNIGGLVPGYVDVEAHGAYFKGAISRRVHSFGTFCLLAILYFKICEIRRHVLNERVEAVVLSRFGPYPSPQAQNMDQNVFWDFYSVKSVPGHSWSLLVTGNDSWSHLVTFAKVLVTPGNKYHYLVTSWSHMATYLSHLDTTCYVIYDILV